jgi:N-carbamoyl-L-amino-acid hydrolase
VAFDAALAQRLSRLLGDAPILPTGAGHDAGVLSARVPTAMLFVRNPSGVSHSPAEHATDADCEAGIGALATVLEDLT